MDKTNLNAIVDKFINSPHSMNAGSGKLANRYGTTRDVVIEAKRLARKQLGITATREVVAIVKDCLGITEVETDHQSGTQKFIVNSDKPLSPKEIEVMVGVDNISTFVDRSWLKSHRDGTWTYSVLTICKNKTFTEGKFLQILENIKFDPIKIDITPVDINKDTVDIEISIADFHLDRQTLKQDNIENRSKEYINTVQRLLGNVMGSYNINKCVITIGNDFLNSDNYQGATTNLTPQDNSVSWDKAYEVAFKTLATAISLANECSNEVIVLLINGNHDRTKMYYITHALAVVFDGEPSIKFERTVSMLKYITLGNTFIGYHHGNCKIDELPLIFATSPGSDKDFGNATFREVHTADKHFYMEKEIKGVRILQTPSMVNPDRWSNDNNFINQIRAGLVLVYHPSKGRIALFEHRV